MTLVSQDAILNQSPPIHSVDVCNKYRDFEVPFLLENTMIIQLDQLKSLYETTPEQTLQKYIQPLNDVMEKYEINTNNRIAMFLGQIGEESGGLVITEENLNYRPERLTAVFPSYFRLTNPVPYSHNPEKLANYVYANRMGNGPPSSGDGYRYRGRGFIQLTGYDNYKMFADDHDMNIEDAVSFLETAEGACESAGWYWNKHNCNEPSDDGDYVKVTKIINGGEINLNRRKELFEEALLLLT